MGWAAEVNVCDELAISKPLGFQGESVAFEVWPLGQVAETKPIRRFLQVGAGDVKYGETHMSFTVVVRVVPFARQLYTGDSSRFFVSLRQLEKLPENSQRSMILFIMRITFTTLLLAFLRSRCQ